MFLKSVVSWRLNLHFAYLSSIMLCARWWVGKCECMHCMYVTAITQTIPRAFLMLLDHILSESDYGNILFIMSCIRIRLTA